MLEVFFDAQGLIHYKFISEGCAVNKKIHVKLPQCLRDTMSRKHPEKCA
jgi:hypothetical protein